MRIQEKGSLTVEAILFLIPFMCAFLTLVNMARFVQAEVVIHHAITQTAKQISTYSYIVTKTGMTSQMQVTNAKSSKFITDTAKTVDSVTDFFSSFGELGSGRPENIPGNIETIMNKANASNAAVTEYFNNPEEMVYGALAAAKSSVRGTAMTWVAGGISRLYIRQSILKVSDDPDQYLETIGIVGGMSGLDFSKSKWLTNETGKGNIDIIVTFRLKNLLFPDFNFREREFCLCASTLTW